MDGQNSLTAGIIGQIYDKKFMHFSLKIAYYSSSTLAQRFYPRTLRYFRPKDIHSISLVCELQHGDMHTWKCRRSHRAIPKAWCSDDTFLSPSLSLCKLRIGDIFAFEYSRIGKQISRCRIMRRWTNDTTIVQRERILCSDCSALP